MEYRYGNQLDLDQVTELYRASTLGERRPIDDPAIVTSMLEHANLVVTAWDHGLMVGIARTLTDSAYVGYLSDLAVRESHQRRGIGAAHPEDEGAHGAAVHARAARCTEGPRLLPSDRTQTPRERLDPSGVRTPRGKQVAATANRGEWRARRDLNPQPTGSKPGALSS